MCDSSFSNRFSLDFAYFPSILVLSRERRAQKGITYTDTIEGFIGYMENHGYGVRWKADRKYITFTTPDGIKVRDNKLFDERLLKDNLELYYAMGGCLGPMTNEYAFYKTPARVTR